ncbi:hypothetical protein Snoj_26480 [Streptomyces nojiriensis]|uniref:N-acetyltransferase domain-containing protein n=1 Tax=Streptomyces nojiriensis TaxID=66374 RepID=A0ABQ3SLJ7_9ACTN|nr:hypothetical protein GCM10010205_70080 [Streptomyces nojiriensis]GHI68730.1 hypothetical protein Snoj_26480 [Streptomyces nojiriensis]
MPQWNLATLLRHRTEDFWLYYALRNGAGLQQLRVCERSGHDFARLTWQSCAGCHRAHIVKVRVTSEWQRQGYGTRMITSRPAETVRSRPVSLGTCGSPFPRTWTNPWLAHSSGNCATADTM